jgi:PTH1 family peptidyl-tRNA hydrolase
MNASGESVKLLTAKYKIGIEDLLVVHDDLDLPLGKLRLRQGSSAGGHKGAQSIITCLGTKDFLRLRIGIGRPESEPDVEVCEDDIISFVLEDFTASEKKVMDESLPRASKAITCLLKEGVTVAMNEYN